MFAHITTITTTHIHLCRSSSSSKEQQQQQQQLDQLTIDKVEEELWVAGGGLVRVSFVVVRWCFVVINSSKEATTTTLLSVCLCCALNIIYTHHSMFTTHHTCKSTTLGAPRDRVAVLGERVAAVQLRRHFGVLERLAADPGAAWRAQVLQPGAGLVPAADAQAPARYVYVCMFCVVYSVALFLVRLFSEERSMMRRAGKRGERDTEGGRTCVSAHLLLRAHTCVCLEEEFFLLHTTPQFDDE